jgi:hypothetical protein
MEKWEYATIQVRPKDLLSTLTTHGLDGWEACSVVKLEEGMTTVFNPRAWFIVFKRRLGE